MSQKLSPQDIDVRMTDYLESCISLHVWNRFETARTLDTTSLGKFHSLSFFSTTVKKKLRVMIAGNPDFNIARQTMSIPNLYNPASTIPNLLVTLCI